MNEETSRCILSSVGDADLATRLNERNQSNSENSDEERHAIVTDDVTRTCDAEDALSTLKRKIQRMESSNLTENEKNIIINLMQSIDRDQILNLIKDSPDSLIDSNETNEVGIRSTEAASTFIGSTDHHDEENFIPDHTKEAYTEENQFDNNNDNNNNNNTNNHGGTVRAIPVDDNIVVATSWNNNPGVISGKNNDGFFPRSRKARIGLITIICILIAIIITLLVLLVFEEKDLYPELQIKGIKTNHTLPPRDSYHNIGGSKDESGHNQGNYDTDMLGDYETMDDGFDIQNKIVESYSSEIDVGMDNGLN